MYCAHQNEEGLQQSIIDHLTQTAALARCFGNVFSAGALCEQIALIHDIGKYSAGFQKRILQNGPKVDHSTAGAKELFQLRMPHAAFCVAGHHAGIPDGGNRGDIPESATLMGRLKRPIPDYSAFAQEVTIKPLKEPSFGSGFEDAFFTRMLYSCLVDADFLDTEAFMTKEPVERGGYASIKALLKKLQEKLTAWENPTTAINRKRCEILQSAIHAAAGDKGLYTLTVPTGGGKTMASLAFALHHADKHDMARIIYVVNYTSIIEQTAEVFRNVLGAENVLEHHANVSFEAQSDDDTVNNRLRLSAENWDAPVIVTTNVQFFESLFSNRSSRCRKLHNIANSVIIFDEAQMLPTQYLLPSIRAIQNLIAVYGATAVLCTATQPSLEKFFDLEHKPVEICPDTQELYDFFRRTAIQVIGKHSLQDIAAEMAEKSQVLTIVNTRKDAAALYEQLSDEGRFHLSTLMIPLHRRETLQEIRTALRENRICRVAATSLVEAGVDLDFPCVFRAEAGLDSLIQAAGRCNREGKNDPKDSVVYVFRPESKPPRSMEANIVLLHEIEAMGLELSSPEAVKVYFDALHRLKGEALDQKRIMDAFNRGINGCQFPFATVAKEFRWIESDTKSVLIPLNEQAQACAEALRAGTISREQLRIAGSYMVSVYAKQYEALLQSGVVEPATEELGILRDLTQYHRETGLCVIAEEGVGLFT